ncbi:MAG TPA: hypothetical protein VGD83_36150, partial [Streptosporangiaceae bacterium]
TGSGRTRPAAPAPGAPGPPHRPRRPLPPRCGGTGGGAQPRRCHIVAVRTATLSHRRGPGGRQPAQMRDT